MAEQTEAVLNLSTTVERKHITIDGQQYPLRIQSEFSLNERHRMAGMGRAMAALKDIGSDDEQAAERVSKASDALRETVLQILIGADSIVDKLNDEQKLAVINCFFAQATTPEATTSARSGSSLDSSVSTAEPRKAG